MAQEKNRGGLTHFGTGTSFEGKVEVPHELAIYGNFKGEINCKGEVKIGVKGSVEADINAKSAVIGGRLEGNLITSGSVELEESAVFLGNITAKELIINKGATFHGNSSMADNSSKSKKGEALSVEL